MLEEIHWPPNKTYSYNSEYQPVEFFSQAFYHSKKVDLLLGYFSSSAINVLADGFATFIHNGGTLRVVANDILSSQDKAALLNATKENLPSALIDFSNLKNLKEALNEYGKHFFECLAWLISHGRIEFILTKPKDSRGISHFKEGLFSDGKKEVMFTGSANFTAYGLVENAEKIHVFLGDSDETSMGKIAEFKQQFVELLEKKSDQFDFIDASEVKAAISSEFGGKEIAELLVSEKELLKMRRKATSSKRFKKISSDIEKTINEEINKPKFPFAGGPRDYQILAYQKWIANNRQGIFSMATGTGKTITALNCLLTDWLEHKINLRAIIVVPTTALVLQWKEECEKFNLQNIVLVAGGNKWKADLEFIKLAQRIDSYPFIIITTYASFATKRFQNNLAELPKDTAFIADEAHNLGSKSSLKSIQKFQLERRIGLSATIERQFDDLGNKALQSFFNDTPPYCFSYSMKEAMEKGVLTQYLYYPIVVELDEDELEAYVEISKRLMRYFDTATGKFQKSKEVEFLLLSRKRIIHKARRKLSAFKHILKELYEITNKLQYTFVYVPEGKEADYSKVETSDLDDENKILINTYTKAVSSLNPSIRVGQFSSRSSSREEKLDLFSDGEIDVLTSMKCLDEGVDVPRAEVAIFCSSTGNPRQFVQRRGRVLRKHPKKHLARIYDLVVIPRITGDKEFYYFEKSQVANELRRVKDFMSLSLNSTDTYESLNEILDYYNLNLN